MNAAHRKSEDYKVVLEPGRARRERLYRAGLALVLMLLMVIGLMIYDRDEAPVPAPVIEQEQPAELAPPAVQRREPSTPVETRDEPAAPLGDAAPHEDGHDEPRADGIAAETGRSAGDAVPRAPADGEAGPEALATHPDEATPDEPGANGQALDTVRPEFEAARPDSDTARPERQAAGEPSSAPAEDKAATPRDIPKQEVAIAAPRAPEARPAAASRFQIHLGDFGGTATAQALQDELVRQGHAARVQTRVAVGPFANRRVADEALARLRRDRALGGIIISGSADRFFVQVGVFVNVANAQRLRSELASAGYPVESQARVVLGPYGERNAADEVRAILRSERGIDATVVALP